MEIHRKVSVCPSEGVKCMCDIFIIDRAPITKDHFRQYRVLGKGGFGLVCVSLTSAIFTSL